MNVHKSIKWSSLDPLGPCSAVDNIFLETYIDASVIGPEGKLKLSKKRKPGTNSVSNAAQMTKKQRLD